MGGRGQRITSVKAGNDAPKETKGDWTTDSQDWGLGEDFGFATTGNLRTMAKLLAENERFDETDEAKILTQLRSVMLYTGPWYAEIRKSQKDGKPNEKAVAIEEFLTKAPKYSGTIHRGMPMTREQIAALERGNRIDQAAMSSWSTSRKTAVHFAHSSAEKYGLEPVVFHVQSGTKYGTPVKHISSYAGEEEVLVSKRQKLEVLNKFKSDGITHVTLWEL